MITISLDETNGFEDWAPSESAVFVAGVIYDDGGDKSDTDHERTRICKYYERVIKIAIGDDSLFPQVLHNGNGYDEKIGSVKEAVGKYLGEFLKKGTVDGKEVYKVPRKGKYYLYVNLKSDSGITKLNNENVNLLLKDNFASNLYFHMTTGIIDRLIFHNPLISDIKDVSLNLPTRVTAPFNKEKDSEHVNEYNKQGAGKICRDDSTQFSVANREIYRVALAQKMITNEKTYSINIKDFNVKSINYEDSYGMEFLYLADSVCSNINYKLGKKDSDRWIHAIKERLDNINEPERNMLFVYDDLDIKYAKAFEAYEKGDYYACLEIIYYACQEKGAISQYYNKYWFNSLKEKIHSSGEIGSLSDAINQLERLLRSNKYDQRCGLDIFSSLEKMALSNAERIHKKDMDREIFCLLYLQGISIYCHMGDSPNAEKYLEKYKQYKHLFGPLEYFSPYPRLIIMDLDLLEWDKAEERAKECIDIQEMLYEMAGELEVFGGKNGLSSLDLAKAYSSMGQVLSFKRNAKAEEYFKKALSHYSKNISNYKITQSYLLHHYIDMGDKESYEKEATSYFGNEASLSKRFKYILSKVFDDAPEVNPHYALYVFVKGLYFFEQDKLTDDMYSKLASIEEQLKKAGKEKYNNASVNKHPYEIIYKYLSYLAWKRGDKETATHLIIKAIKHSDNDGSIIKLIKLYTAIDFWYMCGNKEKMDTAISEMVCFAKQSYIAALKNIAESSPREELRGELKKWLTYMYT